MTKEPERARRAPSQFARWIAVPLVAAVAATLLAGAAAAGATTSPGAKSVAAQGRDPMVQAAQAVVHGVAPDGTELDGTFDLRRFRSRDGVLYAVGRLSGTLGTQQVNQIVSLPVTAASNEAPAPAGFGVRQQPTPTPGACDILTLSLGPLDLDLLGLRIALDPINLLIEAIPGPGNLLGNLLCAVAGLLDPGGTVPGVPGGGLAGLIQALLDAIANLLNNLLGL